MFNNLKRGEQIGVIVTLQRANCSAAFKAASHKRAQYRRRFALLDELDAAIDKILRGFSREDSDI